MYRVTVTHGIGDLASDLAAIPAKAQKGLATAVRKNAREGVKLAKGFARESAGPHGKNYYKRIEAEMLTPLSWEYGPSDPKTEFVGAGFRNDAPNLDLPHSADIIGPKLAHDVGETLDGLFW